MPPKVASLSASAVLLAVPMMGAIADPAAAQADPPRFDWTGFYVGAMGDYAWADPSADTSFTSDFDADGDGFTLGVLGGYGIQFGPAFLGLEADMNYADLRTGGQGSGVFSTAGIPTGDYTEEFASRIEWFGTVRARAGFAAGERVLFYGTGGLAFGEVDTDYIRDESYLGPSSYAGSDSSVKVGWTAGGGVEVAVIPSWILKAEYLHVDLEDTDIDIEPTLGATTTLGTLTSDNDFDVVRFGVNHGF